MAQLQWAAQCQKTCLQPSLSLIKPLVSLSITSLYIIPIRCALPSLHTLALLTSKQRLILAAIGLLPNGLPPTGFPQQPADNLATAAINKRQVGSTMLQSLQRRFLMQQTLETPSDRLAPHGK